MRSSPRRLLSFFRSAFCSISDSALKQSADPRIARSYSVVDSPEAGA